MLTAGYSTRFDPPGVIASSTRCHFHVAPPSVLIAEVRVIRPPTAFPPDTTQQPFQITSRSPEPGTRTIFPGAGLDLSVVGRGCDHVSPRSRESHPYRCPA